jgi:Ca2+-binding EF-hand superfamily protein
LISIIQVRKFLILGKCSKDEFLKAITKIGISGFSDQNLLELFDAYDADESGELDYKEFVGALYGNTSIAKKNDEGSNKKSNTKKSLINQQE